MVIRAPAKFIDEIVRGHDQRASHADSRDDIVDCRTDPAHTAALLIRDQFAINAVLRPAIEYRRVVRKRAAIPVQRRIYIRSRSEIVEPPRFSLREQHIEAIGMSVAAPGLSPIECNIDVPAVAPKNADPLTREVRRSWHRTLELRQQWAAHAAAIATRDRRVSDVSGGRFLSTSAVDPLLFVSPRGTPAAYSCASALASRSSSTRARPSSQSSANHGWRSEIAYCESFRDGKVKSGNAVAKGAANPSSNRAFNFESISISGSFREHHAIPKPAVRKQVIVLPLIPGAVGQQTVREVRLRRPTRCTHDSLCLRMIAKQQRSLPSSRGVVPYLTVRHSLVVQRDQRSASA